MNQNINKYKEMAVGFWNKRKPWQKGLLIGTPILLVLIIGIVTFFTTKDSMVPLYKELSTQEAGQIKAELDSRGIKYQLEANGTTIMVPDADAEGLLVDLAAEGLPESGSIDYSFFSNNASWGMTDSEFDVIKLDALQTELANLLTNIEGIKSAEVLINKPEDPVFVSDTAEEASASIVLNTEPGYDFQPDQVEAMYRLVSKTVPNLPEENIVITNQDFQYINQDTASSGSSDTYSAQADIKQGVEQDLQTRVQQMLAAMVGAENVRVSVTTDIDFDQETRTEELVEPVDEENNEGLPVSVQTITETYEGDPNTDGGEAGTGEEEVANYATEDETEGSGDYSNVEESVNYEFNKIKKEITESPYTIRDIGIQVAVDSNKSSADEDGNAEQLTDAEQADVEESISSILNSIITTSIDQETAAAVNTDNSISVVFQPFAETAAAAQAEADTGLPLWSYIVGGILAAAVAVLGFILIRSRRSDREEFYDEETLEEEITEPVQVQEIDEAPETETTAKQKQLEKLAKDSPEDFAKLLRSWMAED